MGDRNAVIVRRLTDHFNETGEPGPMELYDEEIAFVTRGDVGSPRTYMGKQGLAEVTAAFRQVWTKIDAQIIELIENDDVVVSVMRMALRSHEGVSLDVEEAWAYWLRDGRVVRVEQHATRESALGAAGLTG
ncbi:MAG TPA: nuclear transport factor 2 family protein [Solirubrobacterales bacterium]|nr:nuclear transport factor 2 family protein [Solirubrobacterales bacterium]